MTLDHMSFQITENNDDVDANGQGNDNNHNIYENDSVNNNNATTAE